MQAFLFYLLAPLIYALSWLPLRVLYFFSDVLYLVAYKLLGYRTKVVSRNLQNAFPEKGEQERKDIERQFYHHLCDLIVEVVKAITISERQLRRRMYIENVEVIEKFEQKKQSYILVLGHFGNWEWACQSCGFRLNYDANVIYHPLKNEYFDRLMIRTRSRFGTKVVPMKETFKHLLKVKDQMTATALVADQTPSPKNAYWTTFLNQDTPVFWGTEKISQKLNYPIVYFSALRIKRGYYKLVLEELFEEPANSAEGFISEVHTRRLQKDIEQHPAYWLWSHRRWKHKKPD